MAQRGIAGMLAERLSWRHPDASSEDATDRAWIARILAILFGSGGILLLLTLLLEGSPDRDEASLAIIALSALGVAAFILLTYERLPVWCLRTIPAIGTLLASLTVYFAGFEATGSYALYLVWVLIAASLFLDMRLILVHGVICIAAYATVLSLADTRDGLDALRLAMAAGTFVVFAMVMGGISAQLRHVLQKLEAAAKTDSLTGLMNRRALEEAFDTELARAQRGAFGVGVVMLDLDGFKEYNDRHGHQAGDVALRRLSQVLRETTRAIDHVGRVGGEEFAVLAPESSTAGTLALAERLRRAVEVEFSATGNLTASCGVAAYPENGVSRHALMGAADRALYEAKAQGRNRALASRARPPVSSGPLPR